MKAQLSYLDILLQIMAACWIWGFTMLNTLFPVQIYLLGHYVDVRTTYLSSMLCGANAGAYTRRREDRIGHLSRDDIENLFGWGTIMMLVQILLCVPLDFSRPDELVVLRWIVVLLTLTNLLVWLHVLVADAVHRYNRIQEARNAAEAEGSYSPETASSGQAQVDLLAEGRPKQPWRRIGFSPGFIFGVWAVSGGLTIAAIEEGWMRCVVPEGTARWGCAISNAFSQPSFVAAAGTFLVICVAYLVFLSWRLLAGSRVQSNDHVTGRNSSVK